MKSAFQGKTSSNAETLVFGRKELRQAYEMFSDTAQKSLDLVSLGYPFYCLEDLKEVAGLLRGKRVHSEVQLWIWTDEASRSVGERMGIVQDIEAAGGYVLTDTCSVAPPINKCGYGFKNVMTDSLKESGFHLRSGHISSFVGSMEKCIEAAIAGKHQR